MMGVVDTRELLGSAGDLVPKPTQDSKMVSTMHGGVHKQHPDPCFWLYDGPQMAKMCAEVCPSLNLSLVLSPNPVPIQPATHAS